MRDDLVRMARGLGRVVVSRLPDLAWLWRVPRELEDLLVELGSELPGLRIELKSGC